MLRLTLLISIALIGCTGKSTENKVLLQKMDSLQQNITSLKNELQQIKNQDSIKPTPKYDKDTANKAARVDIDSSKNHKTAKPVLIAKEPKPQIVHSDNGERKYYFKGQPQRISVEVSAWDNGRRTIKFYNPFGEVTYKIEDVKMSYSSITELKRMHDNGACALIETGMNPGASMYWYEIKITFDENNNPLWKEEIEKPEMSIEQNLNNKSWWNAKTKSWIKQEIIKEQPAPH